MQDIFLATIQHASWPIAILIALFVLRKEVRSLLGRIRGFKAGKVELKFNEELEQQGFTKKQLATLRTLTADEIDLFLLVSFSEAPNFRYQTGIDPAIFRQHMSRLEESGLLTITNPENDGSNLLHNLTPLGRRARSLFVNSTVELLRKST
ncbi:MAG: hypothetical protein EXR27_02925 [Betaproteobacteria bacterium]|nr:hypothetical protein [Betaproteobacteria bacterium]